MHQARVSIDANVRLHAEMPLVAFLALVPVGIALAGFIFGRGRRGNQGGVDNRAFAQKQTLLGQVGVDGVEDGFGELMLCEQMAKLQEGGGIGHGVAGEINADETADGLAVVAGVFDAFVGVAEALLGNVHAQPGQSFGWATGATVAGIEGRDGLFECRPRGDGFEFGEETITPGRFLLGGVFQFGKARLHRKIIRDKDK